MFNLAAGGVSETDDVRLILVWVQLGARGKKQFANLTALSLASNPGLIGPVPSWGQNGTLRLQFVDFSDCSLSGELQQNAGWRQQ